MPAAKIYGRRYSFTGGANANRVIATGMFAQNTLERSRSASRQRRMLQVRKDLEKHSRAPSETSVKVDFGYKKTKSEYKQQYKRTEQTEEDKKTLQNVFSSPHLNHFQRKSRSLNATATEANLHNVDLDSEIQQVVTKVRPQTGVRSRSVGKSRTVAG